MRRKPLKHVKKYTKEIEEIMGVSGEVWIQHQRLLPAKSNGANKIADAYTLRSVGTSAVSAQRKAGAGCSTSSTIAPGDSSELLGRGIVRERHHY